VVDSVLVKSGATAVAIGVMLALGVPVLAAGGRLVKSTASAHKVQPQPRPGSCHARGQGKFSLPDAGCTPGAIDPAVTQADLGSTICRAGYTKTVRPPESITEREKQASLLAYGDHRPLHFYEYDHLVAPELGAGACVEPRAALANDDVAGDGGLAAEHLHAEVLRIRVAPVLGGAEALLVCHLRVLLLRLEG